MESYLGERAALQSLPISIKCFSSKYRREVHAVDATEPATKSRKRCYLCSCAKNRVTTMKCSLCDEFICKEHSATKIKCISCANLDISDEIQD